MALTEFAVNHPLANKLYSKKLLHESLKETWFSKFIGTEQDSLIQLLPDTKKSAGDKVTYGLRVLLTGDGVQGDETLEGNEENLIFYDDSMLINQLRHAVRSKGKMSEQRVPYSVRDEARQGLTDWFSDRLDTCFMNQLSGNTNITDTKWTGNNAAVATDNSHWIYATGVVGTDAETSLSASSVFSLTLIDRAVVKAKTLSPRIRPLRIGGEEKYVCFIHPYQHYQLRASTATGQYMDIQKAALQGGQRTGNPIYTGAIAEYNNVIFHESTRVPWGTTAQDSTTKTPSAVTSVGRAIFCGAQAGVCGVGQDTSTGLGATWKEEMFDWLKSIVALGRNAYRKVCELGGTLRNQTIPIYA